MARYVQFDFDNWSWLLWVPTRRKEGDNGHSRDDNGHFLAIPPVAQFQIFALVWKRPEAELHEIIEVDRSKVR